MTDIPELITPALTRRLITTEILRQGINPAEVSVHEIGRRLTVLFDEHQVPRQMRATMRHQIMIEVRSMRAETRDLSRLNSHRDW